jgi:hypothetical protein
MRKRYILAKEGHILADEGWLHGLTDDEAALREEMAPYELIDTLMKDVARLEQTVAETHKEVNRLSSGRVVYGNPFGDICNRSQRYHPAVKRYIELYDDTENYWGLY